MVEGATMPRAAGGPGETDASPALSADEVRRIRNSWARVVPAGDLAARMFYGRLFQLDPSLRPLFHADMKRQGEKLLATLDSIVDSLDDLDGLMPAARALATRHVAYGAEPAHYDTVGEALVWAVGQIAGPDFTEADGRAWTRAYAALADEMVAAAHGQRAPAAGRR